MKTKAIQTAKYFSAFSSLKIIPIALLFPLVSVVAQGTPQLQTPGQNFSLEGALALFKKAKTVQQFERSLNHEDNNVNNLDLNKDGQTDYIAVNDIKENNAHVLVLSTSISKNNIQDIATINVEKSSNNEANVQIIGDPDLYPANTIIEPSPYDGPMVASTDTQNTYSNQIANQVGYNVWEWPLVQYLYNPYYSIWNSPYSWYNLPFGYNMWRPKMYTQFYSGGNNYRSHYYHAPRLRVTVSQNIYRAHRGSLGYGQNFRIQNNYFNFDRSNSFAGRYIGHPTYRSIGFRGGHSFGGSGHGGRR
ncbi:hypothetical protein FFWV33_00530 [Flavobacterium faecale]|uniref:DUF3300 domain-containing protein n=1 Tax=Flavobacterium faecale TaxID=1355330 RepID=A0A2S1L8N3_9FLAO|nr:hypothetical protein [Flavobacterium faecale]AWG20109.1 hypothetical protein FFWV33_00530 [Flavobacterium faecale]